MKTYFTIRNFTFIVLMTLGSGIIYLHAVPPVYTNVKPINLSFFGSTYEGWNTLTGFNINDGITNLKDQEGNLTDISVKITERFGGTNTAGSDNTTTSLNLPKEISTKNFFCNTATFGGGIFPKATFIISNLYPDVEYDFAIFASRINATDNRETYYKFSGLESGDTTLYLNPSNNTSNIVEAFKIRPNSNGEITVEVGKGPNNNNATGFSHITALRITPRINIETVPFTSQLNVSFVNGPLDNRWNVLGDFRVNAQATNLRDTTGNFTNVSLVVTERFNQINTAGSEVTDTEMKMPKEVSKSSFYGNTATWLGIIIPKSTIKFTSLDPLRKYDFSVFASRMSATDNRETYYKFSGAIAADTIVYLNASNNTNNIVKAIGISPDSSGEISIEIGPGPNNNNPTGFYHINALNIKTNDIASGMSSSENAKVNLYPNPFQTNLHVFVKNDSEIVKVISIDGRELLSFDRLTPNSYNQFNLSCLSSGTYIIKSGNGKSIVIKK